jgi:hypothetical protein
MNWLRCLLFFFISFLGYIFVNQYFFCPNFSFKTLQPFSGKEFYNPYASINENDWVKCNFHAHTKVWKGFTNGKGTATDIYHAYDSMKYAVHCISDYEKIDTSFSHEPGFIPAYEHGYNLNKTHQLVLGSHEICWTDYLFPQTLNNKQRILNYLSSDPGNVVIINHPANRNGYFPSDFKYLTNYDCMEVLNPFAISLAHWDSALSYGKPAFIVGNDDVHDVFSKDCLARMCTWINVSDIKEVNVLKALKTGRCYGMIIGRQAEELPVLKLFKVTNDTITIAVNKVAQKISFTGQNGRMIASYDNSSSAQYIVKPEDHYIRATFTYEDGTSIFLNPVFRYDGRKIAQSFVSINARKTFAFRLLGIFIFAVYLRSALLVVAPKHIQKKLGKKFIGKKFSYAGNNF